ncbi:MAG: sll0787 family AIR synthase-like protein [Acidocella sp.]|nr:sll0787 family AIR synthase-like protein [Acidocella sp.]
MSLAEITAMLRAAKGVVHKQDIAPVLAQLNLGAASAIAVGDDCAAIPDGDGFLLLAIEGFMPGFIAADPYFAGYCGVMVNLSDIAAMGGRPLAVVDAIWAQDAPHAKPILEGLAAASRRYNVPVVGGHTNTRANADLVSVAILGRAKSLLTSFDAQSGHDLIAVIDLRGTMRRTGLYWDASSDAPAARLRDDIELLPAIAEAGLCSAAKDISMAGIIGTAMMLLEASQCGAEINLATIPKPPHILLEDWLMAFPSFGFLLSALPTQTNTIINMFAGSNIAAAVIGNVNASSHVKIRVVN